MNDPENKPMDDVLASIRKIVRAEKEGAVVTSSAEGPDDRERPAGPASEEPLVLTAEMRTGGGRQAGTGATGMGSGPADDTSTPTAAAQSVGADREVLRAALRELLREELAGGAAGDAVRGIIRDELANGEVGRNISQNVLRMIRAEVTKALQTAR